MEKNMKRRYVLSIVITLVVSCSYSQEQKLSHASPETVSAFLHYYADDGSDLWSAFGFNSQDVAFQWYIAPTDGLVKSIWWKNASSQGDLKKATVRAWRVNRRVLDLPINAVDKTGSMGYYLDTTAGSIPSPFKPYLSAKYNYSIGADTQRVAIDPLQSEAEWLPGKLQVTLDSAKWQGINFLDTGNPFYVKEGELIGFTLSNDSYFTAGNTMMQVFSRNASVFDSSIII